MVMGDNLSDCCGAAFEMDNSGQRRCSECGNKA